MDMLPWHRDTFEQLAAAKAALPHALLLKGPKGIGKLAFARALAKALLCESPAVGGAACGVCSACQWFEQGSHPDYRQIEPASGAEGDADDAEKKSASIAVDQIRVLPDFINMSSHRGGAKAVVIHPAEALNVNAANALLKSLEEPPARTYFLVVAHRPHQLLPTIKSRCQQIALAVPDRKTAGAWLAGQGLRDTELALAHVGDAPLLAAELNGTEYWGARAAFLRHIAAPDFDVLAAADAIRDCPIPYAIVWLQKWSYDIACYRVLGRVRYNPDHESTIARIAAQAGALEVLRFQREMTRTQRIANHPLNPRLFLEQLLFAYRDLVQPPAKAA